MRQLALSKTARTLVAGCMVCLTVSPTATAQPSPPEPTAAPTSGATNREQVEALLIAGGYEAAIDLLTTQIAALNEKRLDIGLQAAELSQLQELYLLLVEVRIVYSNSEFGRPSLAASILDSARKTVRECLSINELRHTQATELDGMQELFDGVRAEMFGKLTVRKLIPDDATVVLSPVDPNSSFVPETLAPLPNEKLFGADNVPAGQYSVRVTADGYRERVDEVEIQAGVTLGSEYALSRGRTKRWWITRASILTAAVVGTILLWPDNPPPEEPPPLPDPPAPPTR